MGQLKLESENMKKSRPILFCSDLIKPIQDDIKTVTRRVIKPQPKEGLNFIRMMFPWKGKSMAEFETSAKHHRPLMYHPLCPYGQLGDELWAREGLRKARSGIMVYEVDGIPVMFDGMSHGWSWKRGSLSGRFMPRMASRITLEILGIGAERVQDISEADALAEGIGEDHVIIGATGAGGCHHEIMGLRYDSGSGDWEHEDAYSAFEELWDRINSKPKPSKRNPYTGKLELCKVAYPWEDVREITKIGKKSSEFYGCKIYTIGNPFCWKITFKRLLP